MTRSKVYDTVIFHSGKGNHYTPDANEDETEQHLYQTYCRPDLVISSIVLKVSPGTLALFLTCRPYR